MTVRIERVDFDHPDSATLRAAQRVELDARYGRDDHEPGTPPSAADTPIFFVAYVDDVPAGCGGLRPLPPPILADAAEVKRMFVRQEARGSGVSTAILRSIEQAALDLGIGRLVLETGLEQPDAMRFYEREGFVRRELFGYYVGSELSVCYEWARSAGSPDVVAEASASSSAPGPTAPAPAD